MAFVSILIKLKYLGFCRPHAICVHMHVAHVLHDTARIYMNTCEIFEALRFFNIFYVFVHVVYLLSLWDVFILVFSFIRFRKCDQTVFTVSSHPL